VTLLQANHVVTRTYPITFSGRVNRADQALELVLAVGVCCLLGFGPLAFGTVQSWSICVLEVAVSFLIATWAVREVVSGDFRTMPNPLFLPMLLFAGVVVVQITLHLTAYWYATWSKGLLWASYAGIFFLVSQVFRCRRWISHFGFFCAGYGFLLSLFAIVQQFTSNGKIYWVVANRNGGWIYGPYVNHAHYAGLMELLVPFPIILAIETRTGKHRRVFFLFAAVVMCSTIFLCQSLGGMISLAAELVVLSLILLRDKRSDYPEILLLGALCISLVAWLAWLRPPGLVERLGRLLNPIADAGVTGRIAIVKDSLKMVRERPVLGWGLGTFPVVYPSFRSFFTNLWVNEAHNDFVQTLVETGIVGFGVACSFLVLLCREGIRNVQHWRDDSRPSMALAAFLGCIGLLIHGLFDFNLQIPANAAFFFALSALATGRFSKSLFYNESADTLG
jgi:O-antigen ligase